MHITPAQIRAARALKNWSQAELAAHVGMATPSIGNIESGKHAPKRDTIEAIQKVFEDHGIEFIPGNGVRQKDEIVTTYEGDEAEEQLLNNIYETMLQEGEGSEVLIYGLEEMDPVENPHEYGLARAQIERLMNAGVTERILGREGNVHFVAPQEFYRWLPAEGFASVPMFIFGSKIALSTDTPPYKSIVIDNKLFSDTCRHLFNFAWDRASLPAKKGKGHA